MQILVTIGSGVCEGAGVEFPTFPLTCVVVLKTLWHYRASVWLLFTCLLCLLDAATATAAANLLFYQLLRVASIEYTVLFVSIRASQYKKTQFLKNDVSKWLLEEKWNK